MTSLVGSTLTVGLHGVADLVGNTADPNYYWSFVVQAQQCGRAEFIRKTYGSQLIINSASEINSAGEIAVMIYNPDPVAPAWETNLRVQTIALLYRVAGSSAPWQPALTSAGDAARFDLSVGENWGFHLFVYLFCILIVG